MQQRTEMIIILSPSFETQFHFNHGWLHGNLRTESIHIGLGTVRQTWIELSQSSVWNRAATLRDVFSSEREG